MVTDERSLTMTGPDRQTAIAWIGLPAWAALCLMIAVAAVYLPVIVDVLPTWTGDEYSSHCLVIPVLVGVLVMRQSNALKNLVDKSSIWGFAPLVVGLLIEALSWFTQTRAVTVLSLVPVLAGLILLLRGRATLGKLWFPLLFLSFLAPLPQSVVLPLSSPIQIISTRMACGAARLIGIPLVEEGFHVLLPRVTVEVVESCSGFKGTLTIIVFGTFYASLFTVAAWRKALLVLMAIPAAICVNVIRIELIILAGYWWGEKAVHSVHDASGWLGLLLSFTILMGLGRMMGCKRISAIA